MELSKRISYEYAEALKSAIVMRRNGTINAATDTELGHICNSIAEWATADMVRKGKLWRTFSQDEDFMAHVRLYVVRSIDKVDIEKQPKQMLVYMKNCGTNAINHFIRDANRKKRQHEDVAIFDVEMKADFYGRRIKELEQSTEEEKDNEQHGRPGNRGVQGRGIQGNEGDGTAAGSHSGGIYARRIADARRAAAERRRNGRRAENADAGLVRARRLAAAAYCKHPQDGERLFLL